MEFASFPILPVQINFLSFFPRVSLMKLLRKITLSNILFHLTSEFFPKDFAGFLGALCENSL